MLVRQSSLKKFGTCARQYYYSEIVGAGEGGETGSLTVLGSVFHYAVDVYETYGYNIDLAIRTFDHYWSNPHLLGLHIDFWHRQTSFDSLKKRGVAMLRKYHDLAPWRDGRLVGSEINFTVPIGDHLLTGTVDKLWVLHNREILEVVDFKTGRMVPEKLRENIQFTAYLYATTRPEFWVGVVGFEDGHERFLGHRRKGAWYHARDGKMFNAGFRENVDYARLLLAIDQMDQAIQKEVFPLDISGESCGYCQFREGLCGVEFQPHFGGYDPYVQPVEIQKRNTI